jgi:hypothetical protein
VSLFKKYKRYSLIVLLLVVMLLLVCSYYNSRAELSDFKKQMLKFELSEQKYLETIDENGIRIVEQEQIILTQEDAINNNLLEIDRLKKIKSQVVINTITQIDSVFVPFLVDSLSNDTISTNNYIIIPKRFALSKEWYNISGKIQKTGLLIDTLSFNNELSLTIGNKSQGLFKKPKPIVLVEYSNPYVKTQSMQNIIIKNELKFYDKKSFWYGLGVGTGLLIPALIK